MNTQINHAHMRIRKYIDIDQSKNWARSWATSHHALSRSEVSVQLKNNSMHVRAE